MTYRFGLRQNRRTAPEPFHLSPGPESRSLKKLPTPVVLALLVVLVFAAYWTSLDGGFVYDDRDLIVDNAYLKNWIAGVEDAAGSPVSSIWTMLGSDFAKIGIHEGDSLALKESSSFENSLHC